MFTPYFPEPIICFLKNFVYMIKVKVEKWRLKRESEGYVIMKESHG